MKPKAKDGWKNVGVTLPASVVDIIKAAGGADPSRGGMPRAMAAILGALPWIAVQLHRELPAEEYAAFAGQMKANMQQVWEIVGAENPPEAFQRAFDEARRQVN